MVEKISPRAGIELGPLITRPVLNPRMYVCMYVCM